MISIGQVKRGLALFVDEESQVSCPAGNAGQLLQVRLHISRGWSPL